MGNVCYQAYKCILYNERFFNFLRSMDGSRVKLVFGPMTILINYGSETLQQLANGVY